MEHNHTTIAANYKWSKRHKDQINLITILFHQTLKKNWPLARGYFGSWGQALVAVAAVERFKEELMYGLSHWDKNKWPM